MIPLFCIKKNYERLPWSYGSWIYNYICNQCLSPPMLWVRISIRARFTTLCDKVCQWLATGRWLSPGLPVSSTNKTDRHDITEILLKVALNTIKQTNHIIKVSYRKSPSRYDFYPIWQQKLDQNNNRTSSVKAKKTPDVKLRIKSRQVNYHGLLSDT